MRRRRRILGSADEREEHQGKTAGSKFPDIASKRC